MIKSGTDSLSLTRAGKLVEATRLIQSMLGVSGEVSGLRTPPVSEVLDPGPLQLTGSVPPELKTAGNHREKCGGDVLERTFRGAAGVLGYRLYIPANGTAQMPVVIMLHGCTQSPEDFARGTGMDQLADEHGFIVAYPRQTSSANPQKCWNWFKPGDQQRGRGEPALIAGIARQILTEQGADAGRVYIAGLSAGGAAAAIMANQYPDVFAAVGVHSGLACGTARDVMSALAAMKQGSSGQRSNSQKHFVPTITFHGDRDHTVDEINSREIVAAAAASIGRETTTVRETGRSAGGRAYSRDVTRDRSGRTLIEQWTIHGSGHAWSGGHPSGSFTDAAGPDASRAMLKFFLEHELSEEAIPG